jgi:ubiquinone/menaquinone biosynthesis C-methylase UbiE
MKLDIGSGRVTLKGYKTLDNDKSVNADYCADIEETLPFKDNSIEEIRAYSVLEHIKTENKVKVMSELYRILKPGGILEIQVPIAGTPQSFQDPTHLSFWNRNSFWYFIKGNGFHESFKKKYSQYNVPGFKKIKDETDKYIYRITLEK